MKTSVHEWKEEDRRYHEDEHVVETYDRRITKKYRLEHKFFTVNKWIDEIKAVDRPLVLDFGCGTGAVTMKLLAAGFKTISIDASLSMVKKTRAKAEQSSLKCRCVVGDVENLPFKDRAFDSVVCAGVLHHIPNIALGAQNMIRVLKKRGRLFITEPFNDKPYISMPYYFVLSLARGLVLLLKRGAPRTEERPIKQEDILSVLDALKAGNFRCEVKYLVYWPLVCGYFPEWIAYHFTMLLNKINGIAKRGDSVIISARSMA